MGDEDIVIIPLFEDRVGDWVDHELPRSIAKEVVHSIIKQLDDEDLEWFYRKLTARKLVEFAEAAETEKRERERLKGPMISEFDRLRLHEK